MNDDAYWNGMAARAKTEGIEQLRENSCPYCGGKLRFSWTPPGRHGALSILCLKCLNGISKTTDDCPPWADTASATSFTTGSGDDLG